MTEIMCRDCAANPPAVLGRCSPCWRDYQDAERARQKAEEKARVAGSRRGRPIWKPDNGGRGHGLGRGRNCE